MNDEEDEDNDEDNDYNRILQSSENMDLSSSQRFENGVNNGQISRQCTRADIFSHSFSNDSNV